ncbi:MAG: hypothetical protein AAB225_07275 [Acidobacteriota bacterium]
MRRLFHLLPLFWVLLSGQASARQDQVACGTTREKWKEELHLHRRAEGLRRSPGLRRQGTAAVPGPADAAAAARQAPGYPDLVVMDDSEGVVARRNEFNLDQRTLTFWATTAPGARYRFGVGENSYDSTAAASGTRVEGLEDDDTRSYVLPFAFPFFGVSYQSVYVNSDGNLTFTAGDTSTSERSLGRVTAGQPRVAGLFRDLDPSRSAQGVRVLAAADRFVVSWVEVPEYREQGLGPVQTFQIRLFPNGRIELAYAGISTRSAVVGIAPGRLQGASTVVCFVCSEDSGREFSAAIAERFGGDSEIDVVTAAQRLYEAHEDAYDYLVIFNSLGLAAGEAALAYEISVRSQATGIGDPPRDIGREFGSASRLKAIVNMGPLSQYPSDPNTPVPGRPLSRESTLGILAHEVGHLFLAYASIRDPLFPAELPMLGRQAAHWSFVFNSEASFLEGNRIRDNGAGASPRFTTVANTEVYSPLDQYLMGLRAAEEVAPVFLVTNATVQAIRQPQRGVSFDGDRLDVRVEDIIATEGRRTPDHTVAQRRYRLAFLLIVPKGVEPAPEDLARVDAIRRQFEAYYQTNSDNRGAAETSLRRSLRLSTFPAAGLVEGGTITASVSIEKPALAPLVIALGARNGLVSAPASVTITAGATRASFPIAGLRPGVEELVAEPADSRYETLTARIQVAPSGAGLRLVVVSGDKQAASSGQALPEPVVLRVVDINNVPYPGRRVETSVSQGGSVSPPAAATDEAGTVSFRWTPGPGPLHELKATLEGGAAVTAIAVGRPVIAAGGVVNAASYQAGVAPGALATIFGANLAAGARASSSYPWPASLGGAQVSWNGAPVPLVLVSDPQVNFLVPLETRPGAAEVVVRTSAGVSAPASVQVAAVSPGIFFDAATNLGAVLVAGTGQTTAERPAAVGEYLEIYATGLGQVTATPGRLRPTELQPQVFIGSQRVAEVTYSGLAPGFLGLYQVNARVPEGTPSGLQPLWLEIGGRRSNEVRVRVR